MRTGESLLTVVLAAFSCAWAWAGQPSVKVWEVPKNGAVDPAKRETWKEAGNGSAPAGGLVIENKLLLVAVVPGSDGPVIFGTREGSAVRVPLAVVGKEGAAGKVTAVSLAKTEGQEKSIRFSMGAVSAEVVLKPRQAFAAIRGVQGATAVDIGSPSRFVMMPDFFAMDMGFDARRVKGEKITALADNFYLHMLDGGNGIVMCVWPGVKPGEAREESTVELFLEGEGEARRFAKGRVAFEKTDPVYVAVLEGKDYWHLEDISSWEAGKAGKSSWARPFEAKWRGSLITKEGKLSPDWNVAILSSYFPEPKRDPRKEKKRVRHTRRGVMYYFDEMLKGNIWWTRDGVPQGNAQGMWGYKRHCWFVGKDTFLYPYVSGKAKKNISKKNQGEKRKAQKAKKEGKEYTPKVFKIENNFELAVIYPMDRAKTTPLDVFVPVDVIRETLGVGPCEYILDKEGVTSAFHGGKKKMHFEGATCGNWDSKLNPLLKKWQKEGKLSDEEKQNVVWLIEDMGTFITAVNERFHAYGDFRKGVEKLCADTPADAPGVKAFVSAVRTQLRTMNKQIGMIPRFDKLIAKWNTDLKKYMELARGAETVDKSLFNIGRVKSVAAPQDTAIATCRRCVNAIRQAVGLALGGGGGSEAAALAVKVREECRKILRNPHPLERY